MAEGMRVKQGNEMNSKMKLVGHLLGVCAMAAAPAMAAPEGVTTVDQIPSTTSTPLYVTDRPPLLASPLVKLPIGSIEPRGWLRHQLELEASGMTGHLPEVSKWCTFEGNAWTDPQGKGTNGWEEVPYWLKGFGDLGYVLKDQRIIDEAKRWFDAIFAAQREDGWFGPEGLRTSSDHKHPDLWPNMAVLNALQNYYEYSKDERVITLMQRYFKWEMNCPDDAFMKGYWPEMRTGDNMESVFWLYNRTGDRSLLDLAEKIQKHTPNWVSRLPMWHNVNLAQGFREPAEYFTLSHDPKQMYGTLHAYNTIMDLYGQVPGGGFGADENARKGFGDPRQGFETCGMVEYMHSFEMLTKITGDPIWSDRCEDVAFNDFPASMTPDLRALHYLTSPNSIRLDEKNHAPDIQNKGPMLAYSPSELQYRCCQHNHGMGWPYYAEELWLATSDQGLCASLYSASTVTAKVNGGAYVKIDETTDYPFSDSVQMKLSMAKPAEFPMYLRVPKWAEGATLQINGKAVESGSKPLSYLRISRTWSDGDTVELTLPMHVSVRVWEKNKNAVSVDYGPLTFSLAIDEQWKQYGGSEKWPEFDVTAGTPWNYGLLLDMAEPDQSFQVIHKPGPVDGQPFTAQTVPIELRGKARRIPNWQEDKLGMVGLLQESPVKSEEPIETIRMIPMGAARLRISEFPVIGHGDTAHDWTPQPASAVFLASASHVNPTDSLDALQSALIPSSSADHGTERFTWWDHRGTSEWVQYDFKTPMNISSTEVYWFDDKSTGGHCRPPASWVVQYKDGEQWKNVENPSGYGVADDNFNQVSFAPVTTTALRLAVQLQDNASGGILSWRIGK
jgi:DUF1680 family protein